MTTPGPWFADIRGGCAAVRSVHPDKAESPGLGEGYPGVLAYAKGYCVDGQKWRLDEHVDSDFRLMAASPEMLAALKIVVDYFDGNKKLSESSLLQYKRAYAAAHNAIAAAER